MQRSTLKQILVDGPVTTLTIRSPSTPFFFFKLKKKLKKINQIILNCHFLFISYFIDYWGHKSIFFVQLEIIRPLVDRLVRLASSTSIRLLVTQEISNSGADSHRLQRAATAISIALSVHFQFKSVGLG